MLDPYKRFLPWLAVASVLLAVVCLAALLKGRAEWPGDNPVHRSAALRAIEGLGATSPVSVDDPAFRKAVEGLRDVEGVATVWLFSPDGRLVYAAGSMARSTPAGTAEELATNDARRVIDALPDDALGPHQRTWLLAASAIQREGEHNDVLRHLLRPIAGKDGSTVAIVGVAYDALSASVGLGWKLAVIGMLLGLAVYWLSLPTWVYLDARQRGENAAAWATFTLVGNLGALIGYLLARVPPVAPQAAGA